MDAHTVVSAILRAHPKLARGVTLGAEDAELLRTANYLRGCSFATSEGMPRTPTYRPDEKPAKPWSHVGKEALAKLREGIEALPSLRAKAGLTEHPCSSGCCAWCGRRLSRAWANRGHHWRDDGADAPLCQDCTIVYDRYGSELWSSDYGTQRGALAECVSGVPCMLGERGPDTLKAFAELVSGPSEIAPTGAVSGAPWGHLDAATVESYRWDRWGAHPRYCPPEYREEAVARWQRKAKLAEMRRTAAAKAQHDKAQPYRF